MSSSKAISQIEYIAHVRKTDKSKQPLATHLSEVGQLASEAAAKLNLGNVGLLIGLLHDLGKYSSEFQNYIKSETGLIDPDIDESVTTGSQRGKIDHSTAGAQWVWRSLSKVGKPGQGQFCGQILALCIASHHSGLINCLSNSGRPVFCERMAKMDDRVHLQECLQNMEVELSSVLEGLERDKIPLVKKLFEKILSIAPSLKELSVEELKIADAFAIGLLTRFLFSCLVDADRTNSAEFENPERKNLRILYKNKFTWHEAITRFEQKMKDFDNNTEVNRIRSAISNDCLTRAKDPKGVYTLTVPTGGGKTFASLRYALHHAQHHKMDRIIYVIPYTSIIEQNAYDVRQVLERSTDQFPWVLEQHSNLEPSRETWHSKLASENWDAPIIFTTMVQFLETIFDRGTRSVRRMHQLANAVLIFDEIQTIPINCVHMFCNVLNFFSQCANTTSVLCTATQPLLDKLKYPQYGELKLAARAELVPDKTALAENLRRVDILNEADRPGGWSEAEIVEQIIRNSKKFGNCLVVVNTKEWARRLYVACAKHTNQEQLYHLSTNQYPIHRRKLLDEIRSKLGERQPVICISTQLIEAGVDISFNSVIRFLAGLDSIAQAAGRCNRHGELQDEDGVPIRGEVIVVNPNDENLGTLEDIKEGQRNSSRMFREYEPNQLLSPESLSQYFRYYFFDRAEAMCYAMPNDPEDSMVNLLSTNERNIGWKAPCLNPTSKLPLMKQSFKDAANEFKAINAPTHAIVIPDQEGKAVVNELCALEQRFDAKKYYETLRKAQQYSVNVFPNVWRQLEKAQATHETQDGSGIFYLDPSIL